MAKSLHMRILLVSGALTFWLLRIYYWLITKEIPFSDMADYNSIALNIVRNFDFSHNSFWKSYQSPGLPALRALQIILTGQGLLGWQLFQTLILFISLIWLLHEIRQRTKTWWLSIILLWIVALSKSSIFWSYKIATEGVAEAFTYCAIASTLWCFRSRNKSSFFVTGVVYAVALLIRPNFFVITPLFILFVLSGILRVKSNIRKKLIRKNIILLGFFSIGLMLLWSPWLIRSYVLYKHVVPFNTHGAYTFLWEIGSTEVKVRHRTVKMSVQDLQNEAPKKFSNDYLAYSYAQGLVSKWLTEHFTDYDDLLIKRLYSSSVKRDIYLTKVSRTVLFPNAINSILIDKSIVVTILGMVGLILLSIKHKHFLVIGMIGISPWLGSILALGYPRMFEPSIPIVIFGITGWLVVFKKI